MALTADPKASLHPAPAVQWNSIQLAYRVLQTGFVLLPLVAGLDKFTMQLCDWSRYLAPIVPRTLGMSPPTIMAIVGVIEVGAAILVLALPRLGAWVVMGWLWAIIVNLLLQHAYYDIALRDFGLSIAAMALGLLAQGSPGWAVRATEPPPSTPA